MSRLGRIRGYIVDFLRYRVLFWLWQMFMLIVAPFGDTLLYVFYRMDLTRPLQPFRARVPILVRLARPEEIEGVARMDEDSSALVELFRNRVRMRQLCHVAVIEDEIVGCDWVCPRPELVPGGVVVPGPGEVYTTDAFTRPDWRGQNIHPEINYRMLQDAKERGYKTAYTLINVDNPRSWKAVKRVGWSWSGTFIWFRLAWTGKEYVWRLAGSLYPLSRLANSSYSRPVPRPEPRVDVKEAPHG